MANTQMIVLKRSPYRESDLIVSGFSPDFGRLDLVFRHGAKADGSAKTPAADLYSEMELEFSEPSRADSTLGNFKDGSVIENFAGLAEKLRHYNFAGAVGSFLLKNSKYNLPMPYTYDVLRGVLASLAAGNPPWTLVQDSCLIKLVFLYESGLLPGSGEANRDFFESLIAAGMDGDVLPQAAPAYWKDLNAYFDALISANHLEK